MQIIIDFILVSWSTFVIPIAIFIFSLIALFWIRKLAVSSFEKWLKKTRWQTDDTLLKAIKSPSFVLCLILSASLALAVSSVPQMWKDLSEKALWTLFVIALASGLIKFISGLLLYYTDRFKMPKREMLIFRRIARVIVVIVAALVALEIWGIPTNPLLLLIAIVVAAAILGFRDSAPNFFAGLQLAATQNVKMGDYIKLDTGEEGTVTNIGWNSTQVRALDKSTMHVPNNQLVRRKIVNYGHPLKKAAEPFYFVTRTQTAELTGLKAANLLELASILKNVPDEVIHYHTHHYLEQRQYLIPELSNDFANWVNDALGNEKLAEKLASVSTFEFTNLEDFRDRLVNIIEEHNSANSHGREAEKGREFHFIKSIRVILPTAFVANDLREFVEALRQISLSSLYFHIFESRLRLGKPTNDFAVWLGNSMGEPELSQEVAGVDPYVYTLEGLRSLLIQVIEKRIK